MKLSLKIQRKNAIVLLSVLAIAGLAMAYFFVYVPANEDYLNQRLFKSIQRVVTNIKAKKDNTFSLMEQLVKTEGQNNQYISTQFGPKSDLQLRNFTNNTPCSPTQLKETTKDVSIQEDGIIEFKITGSCNELAMSYTPKAYFEMLLGNNVFDEVFVAMDSRVVYETLPTGISGKLLDSFLTKDKTNPGATTYPIVLAGSKYQMYLQPFSMDDSTARGFVAGLVAMEKYKAERDQLPIKETIAIIIIGIFVLILLPWIKLFNLGRKDRLTLTDGIMSFIVATLLVSILFLSFSLLALNYQRFGDRDTMKHLAESIDSTTNSFLNKMQLSLGAIDATMLDNPSLKQNVVNLRDSVRNIYGKENDSVEKKLLDSLFSDATTENIYQVFLINKVSSGKKDGKFSKGKETMNWTNDPYNSPPPDLSNRAYFKAIADDEKTIALEPVVSKTTGRFRTILSIPSRNTNTEDNLPQVLAMSFKMAPLMNVQLLKGFSFALTDQHGEVLYHHDSITNLNQYLPEETDEPDKITNAAGIGATTRFDIRYRGVPMKVYSKPIYMANNRYQLFIFSDQRYALAKETGAFSFALLMLFLFFLIVFVQLVIIVLFSSRKTMLNKNRLETDWIWPRPSSASVYSFTTAFHVVLFIILAGTYYKFAFIPFLFVLLSGASMVTIFVNYLYYLNAKSLGSTRKGNYKIRNIIPLAVVWIIILIAAWRQLSGTGDQFTYFLVFNGIGILIGLIIAGLFKARLYGLRLKKLKLRYAAPKIAGNKADLSFVSKYAAMAITRLLITSGLPVLFFYQYAYNYQQSLLTHEIHRDFAAKLIADKTLNRKDSLPINYYTDGIYLQPPDTVKAKKDLVETGLRLDTTQQDVLNRFRVIYNEQTSALDAVRIGSNYEHAIKFRPALGNFERDSGLISYIPINEDSVIRMSSAPITFHFPNAFDDSGDTFQKAGYWMLFIAATLLLYWSIIKVVKKIFALEIPGHPLSRQLSNSILSVSGEMEEKQMTYVVGLPGSNKLDYVLANLTGNKAFEKALVLVDLLHFDAAKQYLQVDTKVLVINRFELSLTQQALFEKSIELLGKAENSNSLKLIVVISSMHPIDLGAKSLLSFGNNAADGSLHLHEKLRELLGQFSIVILPVAYQSEPFEYTGQPQQTFMRREFILNKSMRKLQDPLYQESKLLQRDVVVNRTDEMPEWLAKKIALYGSAKNIPGQEAQDLKELVESWYDNTEANARDQSVWQLQQMATMHYQQIWQSLSPEERYLIYDLAEEGLVNPTDSYHLSMLIQKGLIVRKEEKGQLQLINLSFKNFVLTSVHKTQVEQLKASLSTGTSWSDMQTPLMLIIIGILAILMISQHDTFSSIAGYLTAIGALIPTLNAIFGLIKSSASKAMGQ